MSALAAHFVGRRPELSLLDAALDELDGRRAQAVEIVGAAGIGKTRLLAELAARADARGHIVLSGAGADLERDLPFWVFVDALDEYLDGVEPRRLANLDEDVRVELAQVFPSLSDLGRGGSPGACTSATGPTGRCASCSSGSRPPSRWCSSSTTSTGPTPRRSSSRPACCAGRRPPACCSCWRPGPHQRRRGCQRHRAARCEPGS